MRNIFLVFVVLLIPALCMAGPRGILEVNSEPTGAKIYIDGTYVGKTPYQNYRISVGRHEVKAFLNSDFPEKVEIVNIRTEDPVALTFSFTAGGGGSFGGIEEAPVIKKHTGNVVFASNPPGATVCLKGQTPKKSPRSFKKVDVGRYNVEFRLNSKSLKGSFDVIRDETVTLIADFNKNKIINRWLEDKKEDTERKARLKRTKEDLYNFVENLMDYNCGSCGASRACCIYQDVDSILKQVAHSSGYKNSCSDTYSCGYDNINNKYNFKLNVYYDNNKKTVVACIDYRLHYTKYRGSGRPGTNVDEGCIDFDYKIDPDDMKLMIN